MLEQPPLALALKGRVDACRVGIRKTLLKGHLDERRRASLLGEAPLQFAGFDLLARLLSSGVSLSDLQLREQLAQTSKHTAKLQPAQHQFFLSKVTDIIGGVQVALPPSLMEFTAQLFFPADSSFQYPFQTVQRLVQALARRLQVDSPIRTRVADVLANISSNRRFSLLVQPLAIRSVSVFKSMIEKNYNMALQESLFVMFHNLSKRVTSDRVEAFMTAFQILTDAVESSVARLQIAKSEDTAAVRLAPMISSVMHFLQYHHKVMFSGMYYFWTSAISVIEKLTAPAALVEWGQCAQLLIKRMIDDPEFMDYLWEDFDLVNYIIEHIKVRDSPALKYALACFKKFAGHPDRLLQSFDQECGQYIDIICKYLAEGVQPSLAVSCLYSFMKTELRFKEYYRRGTDVAFNALANFICQVTKSGLTGEQVDIDLTLALRGVLMGLEMDDSRAKEQGDLLFKWGAAKAIESLQDNRHEDVYKVASSIVEKYLQ